MKYDINNILMIIIGLILFIVGVLLIIHLTVVSIDSFSLEEIRIDKVPCMDNNGRPFENELCEKKIYCSNWGVAGDFKCKNVPHAKGEGQ